jgi:hypothetical protein
MLNSFTSLLKDIEKPTWAKQTPRTYMGVECGVNFQKCGIEGNATPWRRRIKSVARKMSTS